jgi:hypothetical protein
MRISASFLRTIAEIRQERGGSKSSAGARLTRRGFLPIFLCQANTEKCPLPATYQT